MGNANINKNNFHIHTKGLFTPCEIPNRKGDYVSSCQFSGKVSSVYYFVKGGVIRVSDHWGAVASCVWNLAGLDHVNNHGCIKLDSQIAGFCSYKSMIENAKISSNLMEAYGNGNEPLRMKYFNQLQNRLNA